MGGGLRKLVGFALLSAAVFVAPMLITRATMDIYTPDTAPSADVALIFGAIVRGGEISPLHKERLDAGLTLLNNEKVSRLTVSNAPRAATIMQEYLIAQGVDPNQIERDAQAFRTPDTCDVEAERLTPRKAALISQRFHLPRIKLHCRAYGFEKIYIAADSTSREKAPLATRITLRSTRFLREAALCWSVLLGLYPNS